MLFIVLIYLIILLFVRYVVDYEVCLVRSKLYKLIKVFNSFLKYKIIKFEMIWDRNSKYIFDIFFVKIYEYLMI